MRAPPRHARAPAPRHPLESRADRARCSNLQMTAPKKKASKPYRPSLHGPYQPAKVAVYHLPPTITAEALLLYFRAYGVVDDITFEVQPTTISAVVQFEHERAARSAARHVIHQIGTSTVLVLRVHARQLPTRPFPGMDPLSSPLREALLHELLETLAVASPSISFSDALLALACTL